MSPLFRTAVKPDTRLSDMIFGSSPRELSILADACRRRADEAQDRYYRSGFRDIHSLDIFLSASQSAKLLDDAIQASGKP